MDNITIHEQLLADCHLLGRLPSSALLLSRNAALPWFIVVPDTQLRDVLDLPEEHRQAVIADCAGVSLFIKQVLGYDKVNFAGLGNVVPDMHLHIVGRCDDDACWPQPVWGNLPAGGEYEKAQLQEWQQELAIMIGLSSVPIL